MPLDMRTYHVADVKYLVRWVGALKLASINARHFFFFFLARATVCGCNTHPAHVRLFFFFLMCAMFLWRSGARAWHATARAAGLRAMAQHAAVLLPPPSHT